MNISVAAKHKKRYIALGCVGLALLILFVSCAVYLGTYYRADTTAMATFSFGEGVTVTALENGNTTFAPQSPRAGLIFYPGGKVEHTAYEPLMLALAERGIFCVLAEMPFRLAVLDVNAADGIIEAYPTIEAWYIGGHSLGGSMAASYLSKHAEDFAGLVLLAAYSTADLSHTDLLTLSVYGSCDRVMNAEKYAKYKKNLPNLTERVIEGGNHAGFGVYGAQKGDGTPTLVGNEQIRMTADAVAGFMVDR